VSAGVRDARVLVTGPTGQVAQPLAITLAEHNEVWGVARFRDAAARERLENAGVRCVAADLAAGTYEGLPERVDYVLNFAVAHGGPDDFDRDLAANAEATGLLMQRFRDARAFLHCSTTGVYEPAGHHRLRETDPLGDNHRVMMPTYSICKIAAEAVARTAARQLDLPTTIARLNVPYGDNGGWPVFHLEMMLAGQPVPVHPDAPNLYNPIHDDDIAAQVPRLLEVAGVPATIVNWAGREQASIEEWCEYMGELTGREARFESTDQTISSVTTDNTRMHELIGETTVTWRDGFRRMVAARHPELLDGKQEVPR
jgi:UDP-glucuronate 4-epimerase